MRRLRTCLTVAITATLAAQVIPPSGVKQLDQIRERAAQSLRGLPNYTCLEIIERSERPESAKQFTPVDTVRLEVALINGKEMFAWPGAEEFLAGDLLELVRRGAVGDGGFATHARNVFMTPAADFVFAGEEAGDGRRLIRYDYRVPLGRGGLRLRASPREITVGYRGSFWVDAGSLDLVRLGMTAENVPADFDITAAEDVIEYARVAIGGSDFLLPVYEEMTLTDSAGTLSRNRTRFSGCRQYTGSSVLSFGETLPAGEPASAPEIAEVPLPGGLTFSVLLETPLNSETAYVGQAVRARVLNDAKRGGKVIVPKGAIAVGRIVEMQARSRPVPQVRLGLHFTRLEYGRTRSAFTAKLEALQLPGSVTIPPSSTQVRLPGPSTRTFLWMELSEQKTGLAILTAGTSRLSFPVYLQLIWRTSAPESAK